MIDGVEQRWSRWAQGLTSRSRFVLSLVAMSCFGFAVAHLPSVVDRSLDVVANCMSAAWVVAPLLVGRAQKSLAYATIGTAVAEVAGIAAFYVETFPRLDADYLRLPVSSPLPAVIWAACGDWVSTHSQWFVAALVTGVVVGALGYWWRVSGSRWLGMLAAAPFLLEPFFVWFSPGGMPGSHTLWAYEFGLGVLMLVAVLRASAGRSSPARASA